MPSAMNQTITIVNNSGKIVKTSKHLVNVFKETKSAYDERKAELKAQRRNEAEIREKERQAQGQLQGLSLYDDDDRISHRSHQPSRAGSESGRSVRRKPVPPPRSNRPPVARGLSDTFYANEAPVRRESVQPRPSHLRRDSSLSVQEDEDLRAGELRRRNTDGMELRGRRRPHPLPTSRSARATSADSVDMDLAYGDLPPPPVESKREDELELRDKMTYLQRLLDEGNCVQHSVTAMIETLQKNPDALAAVALTLAEISNLAAKMAPGALMAMKGSFPAIIALLASPQFAIAAGVGVGVTIIAFGGYKIVKRIQARNAENRERLLVENALPPADSPVEDETTLRELGHIERWRRGIAAEQANSIGTSVEGEFITPSASRTLIEDGRLTEADLLPIEARSTRSTKKPKSRKAPTTASTKTRRKSSVAGSQVSSSSSNARRQGSKSAKAPRETSILKNMFKGKSGGKYE